jgi:hypothetical protein
MVWRAFDNWCLTRSQAAVKSTKATPWWRWLRARVKAECPPGQGEWSPPDGAPGTFGACFGMARERCATKSTRTPGGVEKDRPVFGWSGIYGDAHRGGIVASYVLAAAAVMLAVVGGMAHHYQHHNVAILAGALEFGMIVLIYALAAISRLDGWSLAYADGRILAEALRVMGRVGELGVHTPMPRLPHYLAGDESSAAERRWVIWYFRALVRMAPLRLGAVPGELAKVRDSLAGEWLQGQIEFHRSNGLKQHWLHKKVERLAPCFFVAVLLAVVVHLGAALLHTEGQGSGFSVLDLLHWLILSLCVIGPAMIGALHGFTAQLDTSRLEQRARSMVSLLEQRQSAIKQLDLSSDPHGAEAVWGLATEALAASSLMMDETAGWSLIYKNTDIPLG